MQKQLQEYKKHERKRRDMRESRDQRERERERERESLSSIIYHKKHP